MAIFKDLLAYKKAFELALEIQVVTKNFPKEERYSLTDQMKRSSRSVCINMAEGLGNLGIKRILFQK